MDEESIGALVKYSLCHMKSVEERLQWSKAPFKKNDKRVFQNAINKVNSAINDITLLTNNSELSIKIKEELSKRDIIYFLTLTEQLMDLDEYHLSNITNLIEDYLNKNVKDGD